jgi:hypothetical protein
MIIKKQDASMKKQTAFLFLAMTLSFSAWGQIATAKPVCTQRCFAMDPATARKSLSDEKLKMIRESIRSETDGVKLQELKKTEEREIEKHQDDLEKMCTTICKNNPED